MLVDLFILCFLPLLVYSFVCILNYEGINLVSSNHLKLPRAHTTY